MEREKRGCLTVKGRKYYVYDGLNTIGRDKQATVIVKDLGVSHQQAILTIVDETRHFISDFNSSNGTHINNEKLVPYKLYEIKDGSVIFFSVDVEATYKKISRSDLSDTNTNSTLQNTQMDDNFYAASTQIFNDTNFYTNKSTDLTPANASTFAIPDDGFDFNMVDTQKLKDLQNIPSVSTKTLPDLHNLPTQLNFKKANKQNIPSASPKTLPDLYDLPTQVNKQDLKSRNIPSAGKKTIPDLHDLPTQLNLKDLPNVPSSSTKTIQDLHDLPTQLVTSETTTDKIDFHDMPTQLIDSEPSSEISSQNTQINPLDFHDMPTQLILPPEEGLKSAQKEEELEFVVGKNVSIYDAETQLLAGDTSSKVEPATCKNCSDSTTISNDGVNILENTEEKNDDDGVNILQNTEEKNDDDGVNILQNTEEKNDDDGVNILQNTEEKNDDDDGVNILQNTEEKNNDDGVNNLQNTEKKNDDDDDDDATQEYHVETLAGNSETDSAEAAEPTSPISPNTTNTSSSKNLLETTTDSDEFLAAGTETVLKTLVDQDPQLHLKKSYDIESASSNDSDKPIQIEQVKSPQEDSNPPGQTDSDPVTQLHTSQLKRRVHNKIVSDDETEIDESSNDSVNFLAAAHSTLATQADSDPQSQLPMHLLRKRSSNRLNSNDIKCAEESNQAKTAVEDKTACSEQSNQANSDADTDVEVATKTTPDNESDSRTDIEEVESPDKCENSDSDPQSLLQVHQLKNKSRSHIIIDRGSSSSDFEEDANRSKRKRPMKTRKERDDDQNITPRTYSRKKSLTIVKNTDSDTEQNKTTTIAGDSDSNTDVDGNVSHNMTTSILCPTDIENSFVKRRSFMDVSNDVIPATQEMANTSAVSFTKGLSTIIDVTGQDIPDSESSFKLGLTQDEEEMRKNDVYVVKGLEDNNSADSFDFAGPTQKMQNLNDDDEDFDFAGPTQKSAPNSSNKGESLTENDDIFDTSTQKVDSEVFKRPLQKRSILKTSLREKDLDDSDLFMAATQVLHPDNNKRGNTQEAADNLDDSDLFIAATQKVVTETTSVKVMNDSDIFCAATQKMDFNKSESPGLNNSKKMDDTLFSAATQKMESASTSRDEHDDNDSIFFAATQVSETSEVVALPRNINTQDTVTVADSNSFNLRDDEVLLNESTASDTSKENRKRVSFGKIRDIESDVANKNKDIESVPANKNKDNETVPADKNKDIESQMEVMFATQTLHLTEPDPTRPENPVQECSTQDVVKSLMAEENVPKVGPRRSRRNSKGHEEPDEPVTRRRTRKQSTDKEETDGSVALKTISEVRKTVSSPRKSKLSTIQTGVDEEKEDDSNIDGFESYYEAHCSTSSTSTTISAMEVLNAKAENKRSTRGRKKKLETLDEEYPIKKRQTRSDKSSPVRDSDTKSEEEKPATRKRTSRKKEEPAEVKPTRGRPRGSKKISADNSVESKAQQGLTNGDDSEASLVPSKERSLRKPRVAAQVSRKRKSSDSDDDCLITITVPKKQKSITISDDSGDDKSKIDVSGKRGLKVEAHSFSLLSTPERAKRKLKPKVAFTMFDSPELSSLIRTLGGMMVDNIDTSTVLVTKTILRSQKLLCAIGQCKPICSPLWLEECKKAHAFLDPWEFLIEDVEAEKKWNFSIKESYNRSKCRKLFEGYSFHVLATKATDVLKAAIESSGGRCVAKTPKAGNFVVVAAQENRGKCTKYFKQNVKVVLPEAIFDGVLRQDIVFDKHLLT